MLHELPVFQGCIDNIDGVYTYHIHHWFTGIEGELVISSPEFFDTAEIASVHMKQAIKDICYYMAIRSREILVDPSKFVDVSESSVENYSRENLH